MTGLADRWSEALTAAADGPAPVWLQRLRETAAGEFRAAGLPHRRVEAWKYTPMTVFDGLQPARQPASEAESDLPEPLCGAGAVVDIRDGTLGDVPADLPRGVTLLPLAEGLERFEARLKPLFEAVELKGATRAFAALNTALARQGLVVHVDRSAVDSQESARVLLRWSSSAGAAATMGQFRLFVLLDDGARLDLVEQFMGADGDPDGGVAGLNVLCQAELGEGATLGHTRFQAAPEHVVLLTSTLLGQARDSRFVYRGFDLGAGLARHELTVRLSGPGAAADIAGAWLLDGQRHVDNHVAVEHLGPGCASEQFFRGVLGGRSRGVFNGRALIQPGADGSSVRQSNANLLLSPLAEMDTKPELEIYADEVEASHGATVGQLDEAAVFYLRSRGLSDAAARRMLTTAFCRAVTDRVTDPELSGRIADLLDAAMPKM